MAFLNSLVASLVLTTVSAPKQAPPKAIWPGFGVNIHFTEASQSEFKLLKDLGIQYARLEFKWEEIERVQGQYDFSTYDKLVRNLIERGIRPFFVLNSGNKLYQDGAPESSGAQSAFGRWAGAAAAHYQGKEILWEIWDEPNLPNSWRPAPNPSAYKSLCKLSTQLMKQADPNCRVIVGVTGGIDQDFLIKSLDQQLISIVDGISVHPNRPAGPESVWVDWEQLRVLIDALAPEGRKGLPLICSSWGYSTSKNGVSEGRQAMYLTRSWLLNAAAGVPVSVNYDWKDDVRPLNKESQFGLLNQDLKIKPSYVAAKEFLQRFSGCSVYKRYVDSDALRWTIVGGAVGKMVRASWYQRDPGIKYETLNPKDGPRMYSELMGNREAIPNPVISPTQLAQVQVIFASPLDQDGWCALISKSTPDPAKLEFRYTRKDNGAKVTCFANINGPSSIETLADSTSNAEVSVSLPGRQPYIAKLLETPVDPSNWIMEYTVDGVKAARQPLESGNRTSIARYVFTKGAQFVCIEPKFEIPIPPGAKRAVLWVKSERTDNILRSRFQDETGQVFQVDLGKLDGEVQRAGFKSFVISLDGSKIQSFWNGPNDGKPKGKLFWNALLVVDSANRENPKSGTVEFGTIAYEL
jgi:hypothetical protein